MPDGCACAEGEQIIITSFFLSLLCVIFVVAEPLLLLLLSLSSLLLVLGVVFCSNIAVGLVYILCDSFVSTTGPPDLS